MIPSTPPSGEKIPIPAGLNVVHVDAGREWRGGQRQALTLCRGLKDLGVPQILVCPPGSPLGEEARKAGIPVEPMALRGELDLFSAWRLRRLLTERSATLLHAHDAHGHAVAWMAARKMPQVALVVSRRVDFAISKNIFSRRKYLDPRVRYFAISNGVRDVLVEGGVAPDRIFIVPSGVDPARFTFQVPRDKMRRELGIPEGVPVIGTIGSLVDHKDHKTLIAALPAVRKRFPTAQCLIVGEGELRPDLERQIAELNLKDCVRPIGYREDVETFLSGFDLFALSSHLEGLCTSVADAMLFRLPVVGTRTGGVPDLVRDGETGLLVEPKQPDSLADAIVRLLEDPALAQRLGAAGERHVHGQFTAEALVRNSVAAYGKVLREHSRPT
jgi:glycosyltransferase involved in cell wall biosynthesis